MNSSTDSIVELAGKWLSTRRALSKSPPSIYFSLDIYTADFDILKGIGPAFNYLPQQTNIREKRHIQAHKQK